MRTITRLTLLRSNGPPLAVTKSDSKFLLIGHFLAKKVYDNKCLLNCILTLIGILNIRQLQALHNISVMYNILKDQKSRIQYDTKFIQHRNNYVSIYIHYHAIPTRFHPLDIP